jgi:AcrR family transcriptional regulator
MTATVGAGTPNRRRADARRNVDLIVAAATSVLSERPDATMDDIAVAAGVTRQTVYAHFSSRDALIGAVFESIMAEALTTIADAHLDTLAPTAALRHFLDISDEIVRRYPIMLQPSVVPPGAGGHEDPHAPFAAVLERITKRGQRAGEFDRHVPARWLVSATFALTHAASNQVVAGHLAQARAADILRDSVLRMYGQPASRH